MEEPTFRTSTMHHFFPPSAPDSPLRFVHEQEEIENNPQLQERLKEIGHKVRPHEDSATLFISYAHTFKKEDKESYDKGV